MRKKNLYFGILEFIIGIAIITMSIKNNSVLFGLGCGFIGGSVAILGKYVYWNMPKNKEKLNNYMEKQEIDLNDELKTRIREKSGYIAYKLNMIFLAIAIIAFSIMYSLNILEFDRIMIIFIGFTLILNYLVGVYYYNKISKEYFN